MIILKLMAWPKEWYMMKKCLQTYGWPLGYQFDKYMPFTLISSYSFFWRYEPQIFISIHKDVAKVVNLNHPNVWVQVCEQCVALFKRIMPMVMENLVITQYWYILWYVTIYGYGQCSNVWTWTLYLFVIDNIYHIVWDSRLCHSMHEKVLLCGILLLEGQDGQIWKDYV